MRTLRFWLEAGAFSLLLALARALPRPALLACGSLAGRIGYALDLRRRRIALANLRLAFGPELDRGRSRHLLRASWRHFGRITLDACKLLALDRRAIEPLVRLHGVEHLTAACGRGRGVLLFSGHFGHWELGCAAVAHCLGLPLTLVARPLDNPHLERRLERLRARADNVVIHRRHALRSILRALRAGRTVGLLIDQDARDGGVFVPFFGHPASTTPALALLALRSGAAILPSFSVLGSDGTCDVTFGPPLAVEATTNRAADVLRITAACTAVVESWVRRHPEQWLWMHRRWKSLPPEARAHAVPCGG
jgi:KDO2-lipid IV(A) lauroyltransferase